MEVRTDLARSLKILIFAAAVAWPATSQARFPIKPADCKRLLIPTRPALISPPPIISPPYILKQDAWNYDQIAHEMSLAIFVIAPNPASLPYSLQPGFRSKPCEMFNCKSARRGRFQGLVHSPPELHESYAAWLKNKRELEHMGYRVLGPDYEYLVENEKGERFYSDHDLFALRWLPSGQRAYSEELRQMINQRHGRRLLRHGPLEEFEERELVKLNFPILAFLPNHIQLVIHSRQHLRQVFELYELPWIYD
ncbi:MAG: hypothetical protein AB7G93_07640 [Bdellovibrionales bacterium]